MGVHRWLSLGMLVFLAVHIVTAIVDGYLVERQYMGWTKRDASRLFRDEMNRRA